MSRPRTVLLLLFAVCALPPLLSWFLYHHTELGRNPSTGQHGALIDPPRPLPDWPLVNPLDEAAAAGSLHGKWSLVYLLDGACREACRENLHRMRQLRLTTGKHIHRVQRVLVAANQDSGAGAPWGDFPGQLLLVAPEQAALARLFRRDESDRPFERGRLYLVDPLGNLMMSYEAGADPGGIIKDLKHLLKYSSIG